MSTEKFTIEEIRNYLNQQDSLGDIHHNLSAANIRAANTKKIIEIGDEVCIETDDGPIFTFIEDIKDDCYYYKDNNDVLIYTTIDNITLVD